MSLDLSAFLDSYIGTQRLQNTHPSYAQNFAELDFLRRTYIGGHDWYDASSGFQILGWVWNQDDADQWKRHQTTLNESGYLFRHEREKNSAYARRRRASVYWNYFAPVADIRASAAVRGAGIPELSAGLEYILDDADGGGTNLADWRKQALAWAQVSWAYGIVQMPDIEDGAAPASLDEQIARRIRPYMRVLSPLDLQDWEWQGSARTFRMALINESRARRRADPKPGYEETYQHECWQRVWYADHWELYLNGELDSENAHPFGQVPIVPLILWPDPMEAEPIGVKAMRPIADAVLRIYNLDSWMTEQHANQTFSQLVAVGKDVPRLSGEMDILMGTATYLTIPGADSVTYISPDVTQPQELARAISECIARIRSLAGLATEGEKQSGVKSGMAIALEREDLNAILSAFAATGEAFETSMLQLCAIGMGLDASEIKVKWSRDFTGPDEGMRLERAIMAIEKGQFHGKPMAEIQKSVFDLTLPELDEKDRGEAHDEIDAAAEKRTMLVDASVTAAQGRAARNAPDHAPPGPNEMDVVVNGQNKAAYK